AARRRANTRRSSNQITPVARVSTTSPISNHFIDAPLEPGPCCLLVLAGVQDRQERLLGDLDTTHLLHPLLAFLLLLKKLLLARNVATIALGQDVLAQRLDRGAGD